MLRFWCKSGFRAAFCFLIGALILQPIEGFARFDPSQADDPVWHALLHLDQGKPTLTDPKFLLSADDFSPQSEWQLTVAALSGPQAQEMVCRFPARYLWLKKRMALPEINLAHCHDLQEFLSKAPAQRISLVFASENLAQPSSMLGHLILKVEGVDAQGIDRAHAISFFTDAATWNLPKLLFDSLLIGKQGYFALSPYEDEVKQYVRIEQRALWEYELKLDESQRTLLRYHLMELKGADFVYFFHRHNCATLLKHIVAVAWPSLLQDSSWIDTPKSVVKQAHQARAIAGVHVHAPPRWQIKAIETLLPQAQTSQIQEDVHAQRLDFVEQVGLTPQQRYLSLTLADAYRQYLLEQNPDEVKALDRSYQDQLQSRLSDVAAEYVLSVSPQRDPVRAPNDSQVSLGWQRQQGQTRLIINVLPVSHALMDDNRAYASESELRLFDTALALTPETGRVTLQRFIVYAVKSLLPHDSLTGGWSGQFKIAWDEQPGPALQPRTALLLEGGVGKTLRLGSDVDVYALLSAGLGWRRDGYAYVQPEVGLIMRQIYDMKSQLSVSHLNRPLGRTDGIWTWSFRQSKYLKNGRSLIFEADQRLASQGRRASSVSLTLKQLF